MKWMLLGEKDQDKELRAYSYGQQDTPPLHSDGPKIRDFFVIHFIISGKGIFEADHLNYTLGAYQAFTIFPGVLAYYRAAQENPWSYCWLGFNGILAREILTDSQITEAYPVFGFSEVSRIPKTIDAMVNTKISSPNYKLRIKSLMYSVLADVQQACSVGSVSLATIQSNYIDRAIGYLHDNYSHATVSSAADFIGLNRSYFSSLFKEKIGISPQEYIVDYKMNKAREFLISTTYSISQIAYHLGYSDSNAFSQCFKKTTGLSPSQYRQKMKI